MSYIAVHKNNRILFLHNFNVVVVRKDYSKNSITDCDSIYVFRPPAVIRIENNI